MKNSIKQTLILKGIIIVVTLTIITFYSFAPTQKEIIEENKNVPVTFKNEPLDTLNTAKVK
jgi:hypothetical protein